MFAGKRWAYFRQSEGCLHQIWAGHTGKIPWWPTYSWSAFAQCWQLRHGTNILDRIGPTSYQCGYVCWVVGMRTVCTKSPVSTHFWQTQWLHFSPFYVTVLSIRLAEYQNSKGSNQELNGDKDKDEEGKSQEVQDMSISALEQQWRGSLSKTLFLPLINTKSMNNIPHSKRRRAYSQNLRSGQHMSSIPPLTLSQRGVQIFLGVLKTFNIYLPTVPFLSQALWSLLLFISIEMDQLVNLE
jgi:hypothetical protein